MKQRFSSVLILQLLSAGVFAEGVSIVPAVVEPDANNVLRFSVDVEGVPDPGIRSFALSLAFESDVVQLLDTQVNTLSATPPDPQKITCAAKLIDTGSAETILPAANLILLDSGIGSFVRDTASAGGILVSDNYSPATDISDSATRVTYNAGAAGPIGSKQVGGGSLIEFRCLVGSQVPLGTVVNIQPDLYPGLDGAVLLDQAGSQPVINTFTPGSIVVGGAVNTPPDVDVIPDQENEEGDIGIFLAVIASDPDGDSLTFSALGLPSGLEIDPVTGEITGSLDFTSAGNYGVTVMVTDGTATTDRSFNWLVTNTNRMPSISSAPVLGATQDQLYSYDVEASDPDDGDTLTYSLDTAPAGMSIDPVSGLIEWTPTNGQVGDNPVTVRVSDSGGLFDTQSFTVVVDDVNEAPSISSAPVLGATQDQLYSYDVEASDPDDGDTLTYSLDTAPAGMSIDPVSGLIEWTPTNGQVGDNPVTVRVSDSGGLFDTQSFTVVVDDVNEAPSISSAPVLGATQDQLYSYDVEASDPDDGDTLTYSLDTAPAGMSIDPVSGLIEWTPTNGQVGDNPVTVRVSDSGGLFDTQSFTVVVDDVNEAPSISSAPVLGATQDQLYSYDVEASDPDDGDTLTYSLDTAPAGMSIDPVSGLIEWTPTNGQVGDNPVTVRVSDSGGLFDTQSFTVVVDDVNEAPSISSAPVLGAIQDQLYSYDVEASDPDDGDTLTYSLDTAPAGMSIDPVSGLIEWTPTNGQVGDNPVTVRVSDSGGLFDTQSFTVVVDDVNEAPSISSAPVLGATQDQLYSYDVEASDPDDGDTLTYSLDTAPAGMSIDPVSGLIEWTPTNGQVGDNPVTVRVSDSGGLFDTQSFTVVVDDVNEAPSISSAPVLGATQDQLYSYDVEASDPDDGDTLTYSLDTAPAGMSIDPVSGLIEWTPTNGQVGDNPVTVRVSDSGGLFDTQSFTVVVDDVNEAPSISSAPVLGATQDQLYSYDVEASDPDDGDTLTYSLDTAPAGMSIDPVSGLIEWTPTNGQVGDNPVTVRVSDSGGLFDTQSFTVVVDDVNEAPSISSAPVLGATQDQLYSYDVEASDPDDGDTLTYSLDTAPAGMSIDPVSGLIEWTPTNGQVGDNPVTVRVSDSGGLFDTQSFTVVVDDVNEAPSISSAPVLGATQDQLYSYDVEASDPDDGDTLTYSLDTAPAGMSIDPVSGLIEWTPTNGQVGDNPVTVRVSDSGGLFDTQSFTVVVDDVNEAPSISSAPVLGATQDQLYSYDVEASDPDDGDTLTYSLDTAPAGMSIDPVSGLIEWTPTNGQVGDNPVTVRVSDSGGLFDTQSFTVVVDDVNEAPSISSAPVLGATQDQLYSYDVEASDPDDGDTLTYSLDTAPAGMSIDPVSGLIEWTPTNGQVGDNPVTVRVSDSGGLFDTQSFTVVVDDVNEAPSISSAPVLGATQDQLYSYDVEASDPDDGDTLTYSLDTAPAGMSIDPVSGLIEWTPTNGQVGDNPVTVRVSDSGGLFDTQSFTVVVDDVNEAPSISSAPVLGATQDQLYSYDVEASDPDDGDTLTYSLDTAPAGMSIDPVSGLIEWTPTNGQVGDNPVTVRVSDSGGLFDTQSFTVVVDDVNEAPSISSAPVLGATQDQLYSYDVEASDPDDGDTLTYSLDTAPAGMSIDPVSGLIEWTPTNGQVGDNPVTVRVSDSGGLFDTQSFTVVVDDVNEAPSISSAPVLGATQDQLYSYDVEASDPDDGDTLTYSLDTAPAGMSIDPVSGLIEWTPTNGQVGDNPVTVRVSDSGGLFDTQSFTVVVDDVNEAPSISSAPVLGATQDQLYSYDVEASDPDDGDTLTYSLDTAPAGMSIDPVSGLIEWTPTNGQVGDNPVTVRVSDSGGLFDTQSFTVVVDDVNEAPVADAGADKTAFVGDTVMLDGSGSTDVDGDPLTYFWSLTAPVGSGAVLSDPTAVMPSFAVDVPGDYVAQLIVNDGTVGSVPDTVVVSTENTGPVADAGEDQSAFVGDTVMLDGSGSTDVDGDPLTYFWSLTAPVGSGAVLSDPTAVMPSFAVDVPGDYVAQLIVNDGTVDSVPDTVVVSTENTGPVADAGEDQSAFVGDTVMLDGSGSTDVDGDPLTYFWSLTAPVGSGAVLSDPTAVMPSFAVDVPGDYVAQLIVNDGTVDSVPDTVVVSTENTGPVADAGEDQSAFVGDTVMLDGSGSTDVDGDPLTYFWSLTAPVGSGAVLSDPTAVMPSFAVDVPGDYVAQLIVNDGTVDSVPDTVVVSTENTGPVADAGEDQSAFVGDTVMLDGSGSTDVDGDPLTYFWSLTAPVGSGAVLSDPTAVMPSFAVDVPGDYVAQLIVNDGTVDSVPDTVTITVEDNAELGFIDEASYRLISVRRAIYPYYDYTYDVMFVNTSGQDIDNLVLRVTSGVDDPMLIDDVIEFGFVPAGGSVRSLDTFSFQHNRRLPLDLSVLMWTVE